MTNIRNLGKNIKKLRHQENISQEGLAAATGLKLSNLAKLEGNFNLNPTLETLAAIAKILTHNSIDSLLK